MDRYIFLLKLVGKFGADPELGERLQTILTSLKNTLNGRLVSLHATMGEYDFVAIVDIPEGQDKLLYSCLKALRSPGDIDLTILRAFDYQQIFPGMPQQY